MVQTQPGGRYCHEGELNRLDCVTNSINMIPTKRGSEPSLKEKEYEKYFPASDHCYVHHRYGRLRQEGSRGTAAPTGADPTATIHRAAILRPRQGKPGRCHGESIVHQTLL